MLVCGFLFLSKFFEDFFHVLFLLLDAVPISFPFLEQYTTLDLLWTCRCGSLGFAKLRVLLQFAKWVVSLCLCVCVCVTLLVLFLRNRKFVQSAVTAFKQRMLLLLLFFQWCMRIYFPLEPTTRNLHPFGTEKIVVEGRRRRWVDGYKLRQWEMHQIAPESCTIGQCEKWLWQSSKAQKVSQTGDESAGRLAQTYGVLAPTVSHFYHKLTTLLIVEEEEEATGIPFPSTAWQQSLLLVLDLSNFYQIQPTACKHPNPSLSLSLIFFPHHILGFRLWVLSSPTNFFISLFVFFFLCHSFLPGDHHHCCSSTNLRFLPTEQILGAETCVCCINWVISEMLFFFLNISVNFGWGIGMMMASLKKKQTFQESKKTQIWGIICRNAIIIW